MNTYEGVFILDESLKDESLEDVLGGVRKDIESLGGEVGSVTRLGRRSFARPQKKKESGIFFVMVFELAPDKVAPLHARMKMKNEIFRVQVGRAPVADETRASDRPGETEKREPARKAERAAGTKSAGE